MAEELAKWLADNGRLTVKAEKMNEMSGKLLMYVVGERGIVGYSSYQIMMSDRPASLSMMMSGRQLAADIDRLMAVDIILSHRRVFSTDVFIESDRQIEQVAIEVGSKVLSSMRSSDGNGLAIVLFAVPEKFDPDAQISTVPAVVAGSVK